MVPELRLHLATEVTPLWQATEALMRDTGLEPPFWAFAWPGSQALARLVLDRPDLVRGRRVLDFAAGCGLAGLAAARAGAASVLCADVDPLAVAAIRLNAALNGLSPRVAVTVADLLAADGVPAEPHAHLGDGAVILAGDVCYERAMADRVTCLLVAQADAGAHVLLADPGRAYLPDSRLKVEVRLRVPTSLELEDRDVRETTVYRLRAGSDATSSQTKETPS
nr:50S ribosomal protein L11 methyltransferase [Roseospira visakhapatnamensis]